MDKKPTDLRAYQDALLTVLDSHDDAEEIVRELKENPDLQAMQDYIDTFDQDMVAVAAALVKKWGFKK